MTSPNRIRTLALGAALALLSLPLVLAAQQGMGRGRQSGQDLIGHLLGVSLG